jgi:hypothetical protein
MDPKVAERLADVHPKCIAASLKPRDVDSKPLADWRRHIGQTIERALEIAHLTKQDVSGAMGYADQSALSRWISAVERPHFDKLFSVDRFYDAWVIACAEANPRIAVETVVRIARIA